MPWPVHPTGFFGARGDNDTYRIERSLRFNSADSAYLSRTPASTSTRRIMTVSAWVKISSLQAGAIRGILSGGTGNFWDTFCLHNTTDDVRIFFDGGNGANLISSSLFRDLSAWYHFVFSVDTTQATASNRVRFFVNGVQQTLTGTQPTQNYQITKIFHSSFTQYIGATDGGAGGLNGYLTEFYAIDGQALTPSSFGETDAITGRWKAKAYSGTYGTNGFYLKFADNSGTTSTTLGKDSSGNGNNWTPNNFSVTAGAGNDSLVDSPTNYGTDTGVGGEVRGNYPVFNSVSKNSSITISDGGLRAAFTNNRFQSVTIPIPTTGKWYAEFTVLNGSSSYSIGLGDITQNADGSYSLLSSSPAISYINNGNKNVNGTVNAGGATYTTNDVIGVAVDSDSSSVSFYKNNSLQFTVSGSSFSTYSGRWVFGGDASAFSEVLVFNGGQRPFAYAAPSGFKALCTTNLSIPTIQKPSKYMDVVAYTGTGASNSISSLGFSPDLVWIKNRGTTTDHAVYDTTRGVQAQLSSNTQGSSITSSTGLTAFGANGFTIGTSSLVNTNGTQYVAWSWDEAPIAGMDIVSYTGTGVSRTVPHNLGVAPKMIIAKLTNSAGFQWPVYHSSLTSASSYLWLNSTNAQATDASYWGTAPTSSVFSVGTNANVNNNTSPYIAYLFAEVEGFSKFGSYVGNNSTDGPFAWCGFRPKYILIKNITSTGAPWLVYDSVRSSFNVQEAEIRPNTSEAENGFTLVGSLDFLSNGFKIREDNNTSWLNTPSATFIFAAFAESPFKYARAR